MGGCIKNIQLKKMTFLTRKKMSLLINVIAIKMEVSEMDER